MPKLQATTLNQPAITARPILFSASMVRALIEGRKTQMRRIVKERYIEFMRPCAGHHPTKMKPCPYGQPGDLLWVRESWAINMRATDLLKVFYKAHEHASHTQMHKLIPVEGIPNKYQPTWPRFKPSIHMPRWASRLTLEITNVRCEQLQDITPQDASEEGIFTPEIGFAQHGARTPVLQFAKLWEEINGAGSWGANPFVWVIEFKVHQVNVDEFLQNGHVCAGRTDGFGGYTCVECGKYTERARQTSRAEG